MNKISITALIGIVLMSSHVCASFDKEKLEKAIELGNVDKVRSLLSAYEGKNPSAQERKNLLQHLANTASDVVEHRKETVSLRGSLKDILTYTDKEKARDVSLIGLGSALIALSGWYGKSFYHAYTNPIDPQLAVTGLRYEEKRAKRLSRLTFDGGIASVGLLFGTFALYKGYQCTMQKNALIAAQKIESFFQELVAKNNA